MSLPPQPNAAETAGAGRLARNAAWLVGGDMVARIIALGVAVYLARVLGAAGYGRIGAALGFTSYMLIFVNAGLDPHGSRVVARAADDIGAVLSRIVTARFCLSLVSYAVLGALVFALPGDAVGGRALALVYGGRLFVQALDTGWTLRGRDEMSVVAKGLWVRELANAAGVFALVRGPDPMLLLVPAVYVGAEGLRVAYYFRMLRRGPGALWNRPALSAIGPMLRASAPVAGAKALRLLFYEGDALLITWLSSATEAGYFLVSHKIVLALGVSFGTQFQDNVYPTVSRLQASDPAAAARFVDTVNRAGLAFLLPVAIGVAALSAPVVGLLFGDGFAPAAGVLSTTAFTIPLLLLLAGLNNHLLSAGRDVDVFRSDFIATALHLGLALLWIPAGGAIAAARANVAGRLGALTVAAWRTGRLQGRVPFSRQVGFVLVAAGVMGAIVLFLPVESAILRLFVGSVAYAATLVSLRAVTVTELKELARRIRSGT